MCERENMHEYCVSAVSTAVYNCIKTIYRQNIFSGCLWPIPSPKHNKKTEYILLLCRVGSRSPEIELLLARIVLVVVWRLYIG